MVLIISKDIVDLYETFKQENPLVTQKTPGRSYYKKIVEALFFEYAACFEDKIRGKVISDGKFSLEDQFETCVENLYRHRNVGQSSSSALRGRKLASACGVLPDKYNPILSKAEKKEAEISRLDLIKIYKQSKRDWNWDSIKDKMKKSFGAQRNAITAKKRNMEDLVEWWPFLFEPNGLLCHMLELTGRDVTNSIQAFLVTLAGTLIQYLTIESPKRIPNTKVQRELSNHQDTGKLYAIVAMLANHFNENVKDIVRVIEVC